MTGSLATDPLLRGVPEVDGFKVLEPCVLYERVGAGGMGAVYRGKHLNLDIDVAVKILHTAAVVHRDEDSRFIQRFQREARVLATINHPNLIRVYDASERFGLHYLVLEFVRGETARERVLRKGPLPFEEAATILMFAARGLGAAHSREIVHRDVKPDNLMISSAGEVKVADLGLSKVVNAADEVTLTQTIMGTPQYMSPEQYEDSKGVGPAGDVWSLGATLYFLLAGKDAIPTGTPSEVMKRVCLEPFPALDGMDALSDEAREIYRRCLEKDPADRFADADALAEALERVLSGSRSSLEEDSAGSDRAMGTFVSPPSATLTKIKTIVDEGGLPTAGPEHAASRSGRRGYNEPEQPAREGRNSPRHRAIVWVPLALVLLVAGYALRPLLEGIAPGEPDPQSGAAALDGSTGGDESGAPRADFVQLDWAISKPDTGHDRETGFPLEVYDAATEIELVLIPAGRFIRGASLGDPAARENERPRSEVTIQRPFYLGKYEVTNGQFRRFDPEHRSGSYQGRFSLDGDSQPAVSLRFSDAIAFCEQYGFRLPTETEWEYACRAGTTTAYPWGDHSKDGDGWANGYGESTKKQFGYRWEPFPWDDGVIVTSPVGQFRANAFGVHDMIGNAWEQCADAYIEDAYRLEQDGVRSPPDDPEAPRTMRGGAWNASPEFSRSSARADFDAGAADANRGFRVARDP